ncbi:hypothetical protein Trydic_g17978 [Trypoxylus dichotomus]
MSSEKTEYMYTPMEGRLTVNNRLEIDEDRGNEEKSSSNVDVKMTVEQFGISENGAKSNNNSNDVNSNNSKTFLYLATCIANLIAFTAGICLGWTSPELPKLESNITTPLPAPSTSTESAWIGSLLPLGATIGPFIAGYLADSIGRKKTLLLAGIPFVVAFLSAAFGSSVSIFYGLRFLSGLSVGTVFTVLPMYIGEIADDSVRGALGSLMQLFVTGGLLFSYAIGPYISIYAFNLLCLIPPIMFLVGFFMLIPESPYSLLAQNKETECSQALIKLRGTSDVKNEMEVTKNAVAEAKANKGSFVDIFNAKATTKAMILSIALVTFQQFSGINIVLFYTFAVTGDSMRADIATIMVGVMQVGFSCITPLFVEKQGKRFLLLVSAVGMTISLAGLGYYFRLLDTNSPTACISWLPLGSLVIYNATYCAGFGPLPWAIMGELFPANVKSAAATLTAAICWFLGFLITKYFSVVTAAVGAGISFFIFSGCCVLATLFVYKFVPETSGKSLQEIQEILEGKEDR